MKKTKLLALILAALLLTSLLGACAASVREAEDMEMAYVENGWGGGAKYDASAEAPQAAPEESYVTTQGFESQSVTADEAVTAQPDAPQQTDFTAKIIYSAELELQTTQYDESVAALEASVASFGGFVESSDSCGDVCYEDDGSTRVINRMAYYTVRIPAEHFEQFLSMADGFGNVLSSSRYAENVTSRYTDYEARLDSLYTQQERLLAMLEKADDVESLIALEQRLSDVRYEIESIERNLRNLDMQIGYSTIHLNLREVEIYTPTAPVQRSFGEKMSDSLSDGWSRFVRRVQNFCIDFVYSLPGLVIVVIAAAAGVLIGRKAVRRRRAKMQAQKAAAEEQNKSE